MHLTLSISKEKNNKEKADKISLKDFIGFYYFRSFRTTSSSGVTNNVCC